MASGLVKISVLLVAKEASRLGNYCKQKGYKKSSLLARLVREHLDEEQFKVKSLSVNARPKLTRKT
jgi:hypothetical protein